MDPRFLGYYERELRYLRELGAEFAQHFPKIAGRLGLSDLECTDPHVERLIEAFGFMAARVQLKLDAEFPRFTQHLMELTYPHYLAPTPSLAVVQFVPNPRDGDLLHGFVLPRETVLRTRRGPRELSACEYRTKRDVTLWPVEIVGADYTGLLQELSELLPVPGLSRAKALLRLRLKTTAGLRFDQLRLETLPLFLRGGDDTAFRLYEQLVSHTVAVVLRSGTGAQRTWSQAQPAVRALGFAPDEALLPYCPRSFHGYRLLHEYFAFPSRFAFVELAGLTQGVRRCSADTLDILIVLDSLDPRLEASVDAGRLVPFAAPVVNLFPRVCDRIHLSERSHELHLVVDRSRPLDLEVHSITQVVAHAPGESVQREFQPLYSARARICSPRRASYYTVERRPRLLSSQRRSYGSRTDYTGSEAFLTLVDGDDGPHASELRQLAVTALCTNRDLPLLLTLGQGNDFALQSAAPVVAVRCVAGPTAPRASPLDGAVAWRLIGHLSLNYSSICDAGERPAGEALREMLALYAELGDPSLRPQVEGVRSVAAQAVTRPLPGSGVVGFGRGIEVTLELDERAFAGGGSFVMASVLAHFFAKYTSINSFTETVLRTRERGEVFRWPTMLGLRHTL